MMKPIGLAWIITLPAAGIMAALVFLGFKLSLGNLSKAYFSKIFFPLIICILIFPKVYPQNKENFLEQKFLHSHQKELD